MTLLPSWVSPGEARRAVEAATGRDDARTWQTPYKFYEPKGSRRKSMPRGKKAAVTGDARLRDGKAVGVILAAHTPADRALVLEIAAEWTRARDSQAAAAVTKTRKPKTVVQVDKPRQSAGRDPLPSGRAMARALPAQPGEEADD